MVTPMYLPALAGNAVNARFIQTEDWVLKVRVMRLFVVG